MSKLGPVTRRLVFAWKGLEEQAEKIDDPRADFGCFIASDLPLKLAAVDGAKVVEGLVAQWHMPSA